MPEAERGGIFPCQTMTKNAPPIVNNGAIMTNAMIIKAVMASAVEAELEALFLNAKEGVYL